MLDINPLETNTLVVGQTASISLKEQSSVGIKSSATSTDESIISGITSHFDYSKSSVPRHPGGDAGQRTYIFKANKPGTAAITTQRIFRGKLKYERSIKIMVAA